MTNKATMTVAAQGGDFSTLTEAIACAPRGATLQIQPGHYTGDLHIDKELSLIGAGSAEEVVIEGRLDLSVRAAIAGCSLMGSVTITDGKALLNECRIPVLTVTDSGAPRISECQLGSVSLGGAGSTVSSCGIADRISIQRDAAPRLKSYGIRNGVRIRDTASPTLSSCEITGSAGVGVRIEGGTPTFRRCKIHDNTANGVSIYRSGGGLLQSCEIASNGAPGVAIRGKVSPHLKSCDIHHNARSGVLVLSGATPSLESCKIHHHDEPDVVVNAAAPLLKKCRLSGGSSNGALFLGGSGGTMEGCDLQDHALPELAIGEASTPTIHSCRIHKSRHMGVWIFSDAAPTLTECAVTANARVNIGIRNAAPALHGCRITNSGTNGVTIYSGARPRLEECEIGKNTAPDVAIWAGGDPTLLRCRIHSGKSIGVWVRAEGRAALEDCEITRSKMAGLQVEAGAALLKSCKLHKLPIAVRYNSGSGKLLDCELSNNKEDLVVLAGEPPEQVSSAASA